MTVESQLDGREAPMLLGGTLSGVTMAITRIDDHHAVTVMAWNGQPSRTSKATLSADGKTLTVENDFSAGARYPAGEPQYRNVGAKALTHRSSR